MLRKGHIARTYDFGPLTISCLSDWFADGSHRWPKIDLIVRDRWFSGPSCTPGRRATAYRRLSIPLPYILWRTGYQHPVLMPLHQLFDRVYRRAFRTPR